MKLTSSYYLMLTTAVIILIALSPASAQGPPPPPPPDGIPIDGGVGFLIAGGVAYGASRLRSKWKQDKD